MPKSDAPIDEVERTAAELLLDGHSFYQKFTCAECGARLTMDTPNTLYRSGSCDRCEHITRIEVCGLMAVLKGGAE